jgi:acetyl esterase/lipase
MHGGGWVLGNADTHDRLVRELNPLQDTHATTAAIARATAILTHWLQP